ncbi:DUF559 domain-containing protein [Bifidobacterium thermophilum]|uniref:DUF559 domain-containing protein n=1 Tax=Bifidobacterium thermophilum TaxID=33905 RepID=UPI0030B12884
MNTVYHQESGLLRQANGRRVETTSVRLLRIQAETLVRCRELQARVASPLVFALSTALKLLCIDVPGELDHEELVVVAVSQKTRRRIAGVRCVYWSYPMRQMKLGNIACVAPDTTWLMYARKSGLRALVLLGDALMRRDSDQRWMALRDLRDLCHETHEAIRADRRRMPRGTADCRRAMTLMRENTDSFRESELRLMLMSHGLPTPQVNPAVEIAPGAGVMAGSARRRFFLDLAYPEAKIAVEYDGRHHAGTWEYDVQRRKLLEDAEWSCINATWQDLRDAASRMSFVRSVAMRLSRRIGREVRVHEPMTLRRLVMRLAREARTADKDVNAVSGIQRAVAPPG